MGRPLCRRVRQTLANHGLRESFHNAARRITSGLRSKLGNQDSPENDAGQIVDRSNPIHPFDLAYGVDTCEVQIIWPQTIR